MPTHLENEGTLVAEAQVGNADAFTTLVNQYDRNIYRLTLNITGNPADAEDALQETFFKAYMKLKEFEGRSRFYSWLVRIAINEALMKLRERQADRTVPLDAPIQTEENDLLSREIEDRAEDPEKHYARKELREILEEALQGVKSTNRIVVMLRGLEDLSTEETAEVLNISIPATRSRFLRGRLRLREQLNKYFPSKAKLGSRSQRPATRYCQEFWL